MAPLTVAQALSLAVQHHQAGRLGQAEQLYRQVLATQPKNADALHLLGVLSHQMGRKETSVDLIRQAIALAPRQSTYHCNLGNVLKDQGQLDQAIAAYRAAIQLMPDLAEAHANLGNALKEQGQLDDAIAAYRRALQLKPDLAEAHNSLGNALQGKGQLDEAIAAYRAAIRLKPAYAQAYANLAGALSEQEELDEAVAACRKAIQLKPDLADAHSALGKILKEQGHLDEAIAACRTAIELKPDLAEAHGNLGAALIERGQAAEAGAAFGKAVELNPGLVEAHMGLGKAMEDQGQFNQAAAAYQDAVQLKPDLAEGHGNLGAVMTERGQATEAIAVFRRAIELKPKLAGAHMGLGKAMEDHGEFQQALAAYEKAIQLESDLAQAHYNLAMLLLRLGDLPRGWDEQEWRWKCKYIRPLCRNFAQSQWDGSPLQGRTILLHVEQGFGDTLQMLRYLPVVVERGGRVIVEVPEELIRLVQAMAGSCVVLARESDLPEFDVHCPLMSLPRAFGTRLDSIPQNVPYLRADAKDVEKWRGRLAQHGAAMKVGLAWAGQPKHRNDRNRSIALAKFAPLAQVPGVRFYSLQKGPSAEQAKTPPAGMELIDWTDELNDFADTAALIANLDLVISVDTAVVHLAGAMGKRTWTMLPFVPDWRWLLERTDSPWYPTMRLFRQPAIGDWDSLIRTVAESLAAVRQS